MNTILYKLLICISLLSTVVIKFLVFSALDATHVIKDEDSGFGLFLSGMPREKFHQNLIDNNFSGVVTIFQDELEYPKKISHMQIFMFDSTDQNIGQYFEEACKFIEENIKIGNVLVHCYAGISRSSSIVLAYLMKKYNIPLKKAYSYVKEKRWIVEPNPSFWDQLKEWENKLKST